ncbi:hypothetical protein MRX96_028728 [Rhipicephalus microplus]
MSSANGGSQPTLTFLRHTVGAVLACRGVSLLPSVTWSESLYLTSSVAFGAPGSDRSVTSSSVVQIDVDGCCCCGCVMFVGIWAGIGDSTIVAFVTLVGLVALAVMFVVLAIILVMLAMFEESCARMLSLHSTVTRRSRPGICWTNCMAVVTYAPLVTMSTERARKNRELQGPHTRLCRRLDRFIEGQSVAS